ncbi:MAG: VTT domain-containing protein [Candidatus Scalindua rubra]|uniref:SNARE associated Golgi protein n=1 Tax=Candidatus Scalindua brodae TaxID=237368 RepID=A0A0B0EQ53_9BACT|nr:MAG: SNARE associated Golgi protein [Candidatus Scalindua brodae]MBZ0108931.1 VTT domain-containing protein [Candidatus Scalindua rubra]TWU32124.1 SNARE associated Golgi protein [Candidatus Brocadiaceae bacterium S225]
MSPYLRRVIVIIIALLVPIVPFLIIGEIPGEKWLSRTDDNAFLFGLTGASLLTSDILLPIPSSIIGTFLGARLGIVSGWVWTWSGLMVGNLIGFAAGKYLLKSIKVEMSETPTRVILFLSRPVPVFAEAAAITAGAANISIRQFLIACAAGNAIYAGVLSTNGALLIPKSLAGPGLVLPMALPVITWLIWRRLSRQRQSCE